MSNSFAQQTSIKSVQPVLTNSTYSKVYENVLTEFQRHFPNAEDVQWYNIKKDYLARFSIDDLEYRALLDRKGNLLYKITYGREKHLPANIRKDIKRNYVEFLITLAVFVEEDNRKIWIINLEDDSEHVIVRVENDEIEEVQKYRKANP